MSLVIITPEEAEELRRLQAELPEAYARVARAIPTPPPAHRYTEEGLKELREADAAAGAIVRRIKEILGDKRSHWMG